MYKILLILVTLISGFLNCKSQATSDSIPLGKITAVIDGVPALFNVDSKSTIASPHEGYSVTGGSYDEGDSMIIVSVISQGQKIETGTYIYSNNYKDSPYVAFIKYNPRNSITYTPLTSVITITSITDEYIQGTFSGEVKLNKHKPIIHITNGRFNVRIKEKS
jgi:hypothetical protein